MLNILYYISVGFILYAIYLRKTYLLLNSYKIKGYKFKDLLKYIFRLDYILIFIFPLISLLSFYFSIKSQKVLTELGLVIPLFIYFSLLLNMDKRIKKVFKFDLFFKYIYLIDFLILGLLLFIPIYFLGYLGIYIGFFIFSSFSLLIFVLKYPFILLIKKIIERITIKNLNKKNLNLNFIYSPFSKTIINYLLSITQSKNIFYNKDSKSSFSFILDLRKLEEEKLLFLEIKYYLLKYLDKFKNYNLITNDISVSKYSNNYKNLITTNPNLTRNNSKTILIKKEDYIIIKRDFLHTDVKFNNDKHIFKLPVIDKNSINNFYIAYNLVKLLNLDYKNNNIKVYPGYGTISYFNNVYFLDFENSYKNVLDYLYLDDFLLFKELNRILITSNKNINTQIGFSDIYLLNENLDYRDFKKAKKEGVYIEADQAKLFNKIINKYREKEILVIKDSKGE